MAELDRIRWHCRRGLLELDLVLSRFLDREFGSLSPAEQAAFKVLLELSDNDLWDLVSGRADPGAGPQGRVVARLRGG
jgi:antitoxin CptB